jgi:hypothetical protein
MAARDLVGSAHSCGMIRRPGPAGRPRFACEGRAGDASHTRDPCSVGRSHRVIATTFSPSQTKTFPSPLGARHPPGSRGLTYEGPLGVSLGARYRIAHEAPRTAHLGHRQRRVDPAGARRALPIGRISRCDVDGRGVPAIGSAGRDRVPRGLGPSRSCASPSTRKPCGARSRPLFEIASKRRS